MQCGGPVALAVGVYVRREVQVEHEPHRLGVPVIGGLDQGPIVAMGSWAAASVTAAVGEAWAVPGA